MRWQWRMVGCLWLLGLAIGLSGCGSSKPDVKGKVTYQGKTVVWGSVALIASDGIVYDGWIGLDGMYTIKGVPMGAVKIGVSSSNPEGRGGGKADGDPRKGNDPGDLRPKQDTSGEPPKPEKGKWFPIPDKYSDPLSSGLTSEIKSDGKLDIDLK